MIPRYGVFRKLAPTTYQDKLKRALILRAKKDYSLFNEIYKPSSSTLQKEVTNYIVGYWDGQKVVSQGQGGTPITLADFNSI